MIQNLKKIISYEANTQLIDQNKRHKIIDCLVTIYSINITILTEHMKINQKIWGKLFKNIHQLDILYYIHNNEINYNDIYSYSDSSEDTLIEIAKKIQKHYKIYILTINQNS